MILLRGKTALSYSTARHGKVQRPKTSVKCLIRLDLGTDVRTKLSTVVEIPRRRFVSQQHEVHITLLTCEAYKKYTFAPAQLIQILSRPFRTCNSTSSSECDQIPSCQGLVGVRRSFACDVAQLNGFGLAASCRAVGIAVEVVICEVCEKRLLFTRLRQGPSDREREIQACDVKWRWRRVMHRPVSQHGRTVVDVTEDEKVAGLYNVATTTGMAERAILCCTASDDERGLASKHEGY